jgi:nitroreductase
MTENSRASADALADIVRGRRSIDLFQPTPVSQDVLLDAIEIARWAPNHRLTEPWRFQLIGPKTREAIIALAAAIDTAAKGERAGAARRERLAAIPGFFVLTSSRSQDALTEREDYGACCCAAQNLMLYLWQRGIGVKWTTGGITRDARFYELIGVDISKDQIVGLFWYGVPKIVPTQKRRAVAEIVMERP